MQTSTSIPTDTESEPYYYIQPATIDYRLLENKLNDLHHQGYKVVGIMPGNIDCRPFILLELDIDAQPRFELTPLGEQLTVELAE